MKKLLIIVMLICFIPSYLCADEVDDGLPSDTPAQVKKSARQVIRLGVQNQGVIKMTQTMLENRYTAQQMLAAHEVLMKAKRQNLSEAPIMNKFYESVAKRAKPTQSVRAMEAVRSRYETARNLAAKMTQDREQAGVMTQEIAECMNAGIGHGDMKQITEMLQQRTKAIRSEEAQALFNRGTLNTARTMARSGADSGSVTEVIDKAFQRSYTARDMEKLRNAFRKQAKGSPSASGLAKSYANAIRNGATADNIEGYGSRGARGDFGRGAPGAPAGSETKGRSGGSGSSGREGPERENGRGRGGGRHGEHH